MRGWAEYDRLVRSLALRIIRDHPLAVLETVPVKISDQIARYDNPLNHSMSWKNLQVPVILIAAAALICMAAGGFTIGAARWAAPSASSPLSYCLPRQPPFFRPARWRSGRCFPTLAPLRFWFPMRRRS